jgi:hypothetical protein
VKAFAKPLNLYFDYFPYFKFKYIFPYINT